MRRLAPIAIASLLTLASGAVAAHAQSAGTPAQTPTPGSAVDDAGQKIKKGATEVGEGITRAAKDAWQAGKDAVATGSQKVHDAVATPAPAKQPEPTAGDNPK